MPGLQAALPTGDIEGCADANTQVITVTSITDDFEAYCTFALESKPELCAARTARARVRTAVCARTRDMNIHIEHTHAAAVRALPCCIYCINRTLNENSQTNYQVPDYIDMNSDRATHQ